MQLHSCLIRLCKNKARVEVLHVLLTYNNMLSPICTHFLLQEPAPTPLDAKATRQSKVGRSVKIASRQKYGHPTSLFPDRFFLS